MGVEAKFKYEKSTDKADKKDMHCELSQRRYHATERGIRWCESAELRELKFECYYVYSSC